MADDIWKEMALLQPCLDFLLGRSFKSSHSIYINYKLGRKKKVVNGDNGAPVSRVK